MSTHHLDVALRTAGRLAHKGVLSTTEAAAFILDSWKRHALEAMPAGSTSNAWAAATFALAQGNDFWCGCGEYRTDQPGGKCPGCLDDARRAS